MHKRIVFFILIVLIALPVGAAEFFLDLADTGSTLVVAPGTELKFKLRHRLPGASYRYEVRRTGVLPPFDLGLFRAETAPPPQADEDAQLCRKLLDAMSTARSEADLRLEIARARFQSPNPTCTQRIQGFEQASEAPIGEAVLLGEGQTVIVTITRIDPRREEPWVFEFTTGDQRWLIHYGFSFLPDEDEEYFTKASGDEFVVTRAGDPSGAEFEPTIAFTYVPRFQARNPWVPKFTAGLGADIDEQLVFVGASWVIGDNVSVFVGAAGHQQTRLKGIYEEDQVVKEALTADQLVDDTFNFNAIVGVGFRFNRNPFKKQQATAPPASGTPASPPPPTPAAPPPEPGAAPPPGGTPATPPPGGTPATPPEGGSEGGSGGPR